jgi:uncharacterized protein
VEARPQHALEERALLAEIARALVEAPVHVRVEEEVHNGKTRLHLYVLPPDRGRIIGRRGRTIRAIRQLFSAIGMTEGRQVIVEMVEDES